MNDPKFVNEKPSFDDLFKLRNNVKELDGAICALADGDDVIQRAADLYVQAENVMNEIRDLITEEE